MCLGTNIQTKLMLRNTLSNANYIEEIVILLYVDILPKSTFFR